MAVTITTTSCERWCGWIALRCDLEQVGKTARPYRKYFTDPASDAPTTAPGSEVWIQPSIDRPHWNEVLDALQEDVDFCEDGETTIARDGAIAIPGVFYITDDGQEATVEDNEVPQIKYCILDQLSDILDTRLSERSSTLHRRPEVSSVPDVVQVAESRDRV